MAPKAATPTRSTAPARSTSSNERPAERILVANRKAYHDYHILESIEAGIALTCTEIKSIRAGRANLKDGYARVQGGDVWLYNVHISPYDQGNRYNHEPLRPRKLLLHRWEIGRLSGKSGEQGLTLVPLRIYERKGHAKVELAVARGKRQYDKREAIAERDARREMDRAIKDSAIQRGR